jgi:hypothetical protein
MRGKAIQIDHLVLAANDVAASVAFNTRFLVFAHEGDRAPFTNIRVSSFVL